jgi:hypothetical protein
VSRLGRFLHIERSRAKGADPTRSGAELGRFGAEPPPEIGREAHATAERNPTQAHAEAELAAARRAMGEVLAREVGERERRRLAIGRWGSRSGAFRSIGLLDLLAWLWRLLARRW